MDVYKKIKVANNEKLVILVKNKLTGEMFELPVNTPDEDIEKIESANGDDNDK